MLARLHSVTLEGIEGLICEVEVDVARGGFEKTLIVGLPDAAVKEKQKVGFQENLDEEVKPEDNERIWHD